MLRFGFVAVVALLLSVSPGCRSTPPPDDPAAVALERSAQLPDSRVALEAPEEPEVIPATLDLDAVVALALRRNESVIQSSQGIAIARSRADGTHSQMFMPRITARAGATVLDPQPGLITPIGNLPFRDKNWVNAGIELMVPVFHTANNLYLYDAAALSEDEARLAMRRTEQQVRFVVTQAFFHRLSLERQRDVIREFARSLESQADETRVRVEAGAAIENDVLKIQLALTEQTQALVEIDNAIEMAAMRLNTLLALPRETTYDLVWDRPFETVDLPLAPDLVHQAQDLRPDLRAQDVTIRRLELQRQGEKARFGPNVDLFASYEYTDTEIYDTDQVATLGLALTWEIFDGGTRGHRAAEALHAMYQALSRRRDSGRAVAMEVEQSIRDIENQASAVALGRTAEAQATENLRVQRALYRNNRSTANDLLEAEVQLTRARNTIIQATYAHEIAFGRLESAVGADREHLVGPTRETPVELEEPDELE